MAIFEVAEMIQMAIKDEETGVAFYNAIAEKSGNQKIKTKLMGIAEQEKVHAARFKDMLGSVKEAKVREEYKGQYSDYIKALMENRAFPDMATAVKKAKDAPAAECIGIALRLEKDAILFYEEMLKFVPNTNTNYINDIMNEERNHLTELMELKKIA